MPKHFTDITIIYNPRSSGHSKHVALELVERLQSELNNKQIHVVPTQYAGHAESLATQAALHSSRPLIISVSGDGGYHEVVNGLMTAKQLGATPTAGLVPAGNANDHHRNLHRKDDSDITNVRNGTSRRIDLLRLTATRDGKPLIRYAHSYIGLGLTPQVGRELNKSKLNRLTEALIVIRVLLFRKPVHVIVDGEAHAYDSILMSNVQTFSKYFSVNPAARPDDGKFELTIYRWRYKLRLIRYIIAASTIGLPGARQTDHFTFRTINPTTIQLDGEIYTIDADCEATVELIPSALDCIV